MKGLVLKDRKGNYGELITDIKIEDFDYTYQENNDRNLDFEVYRTERNKDVFDEIKIDKLLEWEDENYTILSVEELEKNLVRTKKITAKHVFMETQFVFIEKDLSQQSINEDYADDVNEDKKDNSNKSAKSHFENPIANKMYNFFKSKDSDLKDIHIFAMMGNAMAESGLKPNAEQVPNNENAGGKGLFQWDDRKFKLYTFASEQNKKWQDPDVQLNFAWEELMNDENKAYRELIKTGNIENATIVFHDYFERSADTETMKKRRVDFAKKFEKEFEVSSNREKYNSSYLDIEKGINFSFDPNGNDPNYPFNQPHLGIDINYIYDEVYSTVKGKATVGYEENGYGNYVWIDAGNGLEVIYGHLSQVNVSNNEEVNTGTLLGISGDTGMSSGPHLHYEMRQDGKAFDPMEWIEDNANGTSEDEFDNDLSAEDEQTNNDNKDFKDKIPTYTLYEYMKYGFDNNNLGFTFEIVGEFPKRQEIKEIGNKNLLKHITDGANIYNYIYFAKNKHIIFYSKAKYYEYIDLPIIYRFNTDEISVNTDIKSLETYIAGYGGKKTEKETKNYNPLKVKDLKLNGSFSEKGTITTETVGDYYTANINSKFGNEMIEWNMKKGNRGGMVKVEMDNKVIGTFNSFSEESSSEKIIIGTKIKKGDHTLKFTFTGEAENGKYDKNAVMYIGTQKTDILNSTAILTGEDIYKWFADYKSVHYDEYEFRQAPTIYEDKVESLEELKEKLQEKINEEPKVEVKTNYIGNDDIKENSLVRLVHKPMGFNTDLKVVKLTRGHPYAKRKTEVEFNNSQSTLLQIQKNISSDKF